MASSEHRPESTLLTYVTHEIGNHLAVVTGFGEMLVEGIGALPPETLAEFARAIVRSGSHLRDLLQSISDLQHIEQERLAVHHQEVDLAALVRDRVDLWRPQLGARRLAVTAPEELAAVADRDRIGAVIAQLLSNVSRYTPSTASIDIALVAAGDYVELTVTDDGPGIAPNRRADLFERGVTTAGQAGAGLFVARHVARAHGGDLTLADRAVGAAFVLQLPR